MNAATDFTKVMQDMMAKFPVDASAFQNAFKTQAAFGEKLSKVALEAAEKSTEISSKWAKETIAKLSTTATAKWRRKTWLLSLKLRKKCRWKPSS